MEQDWPDTITTPRLLLRPFGTADAEVMLAMMTSEDIHRYLGGASSLEAARAQLRGMTPGTTWGSFAVVVAETSEIVGSVSFGREHGDLEISWLLLPQYWGNGYGTEAVAAALLWAFTKTQEPAITAVTQTANEASCRLAERVGMTRVAVFEEFGAEQAKYQVERA